MSTDNNQFFVNSIEKIFANNSEILDQSRQQNPQIKKALKKDLELALTVLLVDLAACDQKFEPQEYQIIANGLRRLFGTTKEQMQALVNQSTLVLKNLRGTNQFAELLKENLAHQDKEAIMQIVETLIDSDGKQDGFEIYLKNKIAGVLGVEVKPLAPQA